MSQPHTKAVSVDAGSVVTVDVEKAVAGGRMLARHQGQVVFVGGAVPGERVAARVERTGRGVAYAETIEVLSSSPDRRESVDWRCGGNAFAHINYARQLSLKSEIIQDTLGRIGHVRLAEPPRVVGSPERGYRMRARLHVHDGRLGFYREGTHQLCDAGATGQLLPETVTWLSAVEGTLRRHARDVTGIEIAENIAGTERAAHLDVRAGIDASVFEPIAEGLVGLSAQAADRRQAVRLAGTPVVMDVLHVRDGDASSALRLRRDVRGFFQGNRFLLEGLVRHVLSLVPDGPVLDLYAGVGLFGLSRAASGADDVTLVEGDPVSAVDLLGNAESFRGRARVERQSVEAFLAPGAHGTAGATSAATVIVDPPRTGLSKDALQGIVRLSPSRMVYVSCDVPTLARDSRGLLDAGYELLGITGLDLFPNTAHVESVALFGR